MRVNDVTGFVSGLIAGTVIMLIVFGNAVDRSNSNAEKSGVWTNGDRAYKLVRIEK